MNINENFSQLRLRFTDPVQHDYEAIRSVILFEQSVTERSEETEIERTTLGEIARRFVLGGMLGLADQRQGNSGRKGHEFPEVIARQILYLKQLYPPINYREIVRILQCTFGYDTNHHTVKHFLEDNPIPVQLEFEFPKFHEFEDAYQARWTVIRMYHEGWNKKSIADLLELSRQHVTRLIDTFKRDGFDGLLDKRTRPLNHPDNQMTFPFLEEVLAVQLEYPRAGRFRVHGLMEYFKGDDDIPSERTVGRAMAYNRVLNGAPEAWVTQGAEAESDKGPPPFEPVYRHQYWFVDIRYLVQLEGQWVYSLCLIEGYSRKILAGMSSPHQDELAILQLVHTALSAYGCPHGIVSDNGSVFTANAYAELLQTLQIERHYIEKGKPWQNYIEAQFKVQLRLADAKFEQAKDLTEIQEQHAAFVQIFNSTNHWAHRDRLDGSTTPTAVLGVKMARALDTALFQKAFRHLQFSRTITRNGYVSVQRFYLYAERGLAKQQVAVWIYENRLHIEYEKIPLARYCCALKRKQKRLRSVSEPILFLTPFISPQPDLLTVDDTQWHKIRLRPYTKRPQSQGPFASQPALFARDLLPQYALEYPDIELKEGYC